MRPFLIVFSAIGIILVIALRGQSNDFTVVYLLINIDYFDSIFASSEEFVIDATIPNAHFILGIERFFWKAHMIFRYLGEGIISLVWIAWIPLPFMNFEAFNWNYDIPM